MPFDVPGLAWPPRSLSLRPGLPVPPESLRRRRSFKLRSGDHRITAAAGAAPGRALRPYCAGQHLGLVTVPPGPGHGYSVAAESAGRWSLSSTPMIMMKTQAVWVPAGPAGRAAAGRRRAGPSAPVTGPCQDWLGSRRGSEPWQPDSLAGSSESRPSESKALTQSRTRSCSLSAGRGRRYSDSVVRVRAAGSNINAQAAESVTQCLGAGLGQAQPPGPPGAACGSRAWPTGRLAAAGLSHVAAGRVPVTPRSLRARPPWHSVSDSDCQGNCHSPGTTQWQVAALPGPVAGSRDSRLPLGPTLAASVTEYY